MHDAFAGFIFWVLVRFGTVLVEIGLQVWQDWSGVESGLTLVFPRK